MWNYSSAARGVLVIVDDKVARVENTTPSVNSECKICNLLSAKRVSRYLIKITMKEWN